MVSGGFNQGFTSSEALTGKQDPMAGIHRINKNYGAHKKSPATVARPF
ncbi:hypothetical protein NC99_02400 [Sunxiuqinia dokdonensis]|uniref:Uncharacterized protein n=1 Tax=Sunxiuqinia dokdonensis TaxID=1409788 RepID=A0A0L8VER6_9BACT|nr:hypothetical protein NC99_02400 [Sunxiuqinia dokdonensis]